MNKRKRWNLLALAAALALLAPALVWAAYPAEVARTGQATSYAVGDDGAIQAGAVWPDPRFSERADGTVSDNLTGLVWAKNANLMVTRDPAFDADGTINDGSVTWQHAIDYVAKLNNENYLNHTDWRLPNVNELESLVHAGVYIPALSANPFTGVQSGIYWSSTSYAYYTDCAWGVVMSDGRIGIGDKPYAGSGGAGFYVWPVRAGQCGSFNNSIICLPKTGQITSYAVGDDGDIQAGVVWPDPRFTVQSDNQSVTDNLTGLM